MSLLRHVAAAPSRVANATGLSQDNIIFAMVLFAFVVWITTKGELPTYLSYFKPVAGTQGPAATHVQASSTTGASATPNAGVFPSAALPAPTTILGKILDPSTDPVVGPVSKALQGFPGMVGSFLGLGN